MVNMLKSKISAIDFANGQIVATDHIKLNGVAFPVQYPHKAIKQLGVRLAMTDDFSEEKAYVIDALNAQFSTVLVTDQSFTLRSLLLFRPLTRARVMVNNARKKAMRSSARGRSSSVTSMLAGAILSESRRAPCGPCM